ELIKLGFDKRFQRMWRFYINSCSAAFTHGRSDVVQLEIVHA
ncbi:class I SAM-dependent methyltransferase, partial [Francisella tularensis subsp. holarctica]